MNLVQCLRDPREKLRWRAINYGDGRPTVSKLWLGASAPIIENTSGYSPNLRTFAAQIQRKMAQDPQAQAIRKRKATIKIARLKAAKEAAEQNVGSKEKKA